MAGKKGMKSYPSWMKKKAIQLYTQAGWSSAEIIEYFGIRDPNRICNWMSQYRKEGEAMFEEKPRGRRPKKDNTAAYIARLEMEVDLLKTYRTELRQGSLAKRAIGSLNITGEDTKGKRCASSWVFRERPTMPGGDDRSGQTGTLLV